MAETVWIQVDSMPDSTGRILKRGDTLELSTDDAVGRANYDRLIRDGIVSATFVSRRAVHFDPS